MVFLYLVGVIQCLLFLGAYAQTTNTTQFWGVQYVTKKTVPQEFEANGYASYRWNIKHSSKSRFPIGSNTKLFTTIAIYQLHENGLLNINDPISLYLNQTDFANFGYPNITKWCPKLYNDNSTNCINVTFIHLLSMSSGIVAAVRCPYPQNSSIHSYCFDFCSIISAPYLGSSSHYISQFILAPLTFLPGTQYEYSNPNFIIAGYIIEKLTNMPYSIYIFNNIIDILGLHDTYYDPWDGELSINNCRVDEYYLWTNKDDLNENIDIGWCLPYGSLGFAGAAGGIVSTNYDMNIFYTEMFNSINSIPKVFKTKESLSSIVYPYTKIHEIGNEYYSQGLFVVYDDINMLWPDKIYYTGGGVCSFAAMKMIPNNESLVVSVFSNAPQMLVPNGQNGIHNLIYNTPYSICNMLRNGNISMNSAFVDSIGDALLYKYQ